VRRWLAGLWPGASGPRVAWLFHRLLSLVFLIAWLSLASQVRRLIGERGLMPLGSFIEAAGRELTVLQYPSLLRTPALASDGVLLGGTLLGAALAVVSFAGVLPRICFATQVVLYLSYTDACRTFLAFQWDNLLLECGLLAAFLPANRPAPLVHLLFRLLVFKLYFESGIAKWQSPIKDWHDGSAMTFYYETAPLPTLLAWYAHNLPAWWHHLESRATLVLELVAPFAIFGPRRARLFAFAALTVFQVANAATANYGFFCYLAAALNVFLLDDADVPRRLDRFMPAAQPHIRRRIGFAGAGVWAVASIVSGLVHFTEVAAVVPLHRLYDGFRVVNSYHLFASITRERIEPQFETLDAGAWTAHDLWHKAGDPARPPDFVAPHQPRLDFQLWFHGLSFQSRQPLYVLMMLERLCRDPAAVEGFFRAPLPRAPEAARLSYWQYHFTTPEERRRTGAWWRRELLVTSEATACDR
jgi:uncharacterized membrane protein YphA (DoxX/SURF4 family)